MDVLTYTRNFAIALKNGDIYKTSLSQDDQIYHIAIAVFLEKAISNNIALNLAGDLLLELIKEQQLTVELKKKIEELKMLEENNPA